MGEWIVVELTPRGEHDDPDQVKRAILRTLKGAEVFVPACVTMVGQDRVIHYLMEGYCFVKLDKRPSADYFKLENSKYCQTVLIKPGSESRYRRLSTVQDQAILRMQDQIKQLTNQGIGIGDLVCITTGPYRSMTATVVEDYQDQVQVFIKLRSKQALLTLPRSFLTVERQPLSSASNRLNNLKDWTELVQPIFAWTESPNRMLETFSQYQRISILGSSANRLYELVYFDRVLVKPNQELSLRTRELARLVDWDTRAAPLHIFYQFVDNPKHPVREETLAHIQVKVLDLARVGGVLGRIQTLWQDVDSLSRSLARENKQKDSVMVQNVLVDGLNLVFRCFYAPGMSSLLDPSGRPTGMILGFLRSLGSLKKRYPDAVLHVVWDGSNKRRKAQFGDYKGQRSTQSLAVVTETGAFDPILFLKDILPNLGVTQAWNPDEEADDVIATLVREPGMAEQSNVIFSTDRDFLQLVTDNTQVLLPAQGSRNDVLHDPDSVRKAWGVPPDKVLELRAFYGDTSDNIPGVPRVPKKILKSLVQTFGSVTGVYKSGLSGLTKNQYERLRNSEPQVRINYELMTLQAVGYHVTPLDVDPHGAAEKLIALAITPESLLGSFFGSK